MGSSESKQLEEQYFQSITQAVYEMCEKEKPTYENALESFEMYRDRLQLSAKNGGKSHLDSWTRAFELIIIQLANSGDTHAIQQLVKGADTLKQLLSGKPKQVNETLASLIGFDEPFMEKIYQIGKNSFEEGHFTDAANVFSLLVSLDPGYSVGWTALGIILHSESRYKESLAAFHYASQIDPQNPISYLYAARCHKQLGQLTQARDALKQALQHASAKPQYVQLVNSIKAEQTKI